MAARVANCSGYVAMAGRTVDDVWAEVVAIARRHVQSGTPVFTPKRRIANVVTEITDRAIHRKSAEPRSQEGNEAPATRAHIAWLWNRLHARERAKSLRFAMALMLEIPGLGMDDAGTFLVFTDRPRADTPFLAKSGDGS
jgi:hypothetical protein